ncbi:MAG: glycosyltransferase family 1 protein, partial [Bacteroidetes bacterium]|nr:glycosyltransferase family 1 protein [Bacteroidota bacterium]
LIGKITYYLSHPDEAEAVRKKGYERALRDHSWGMRFDKMFHILGLLR